MHDIGQSPTIIEFTNGSKLRITQTRQHVVEQLMQHGYADVHEAPPRGGGPQRLMSVLHNDIRMIIED